MHKILEQLLELQVHDQTCHDLEKQLKAIPIEEASLRQRIDEEKAALESERQALLDLEVKKHDLENQLQAAEEKLIKQKTQQISVKKPEEYQALEHSIVTLTDSIDHLENEILAYIDRIEIATQANKLNVKTHQKEIESFIAELHLLENRQKILEKKHIEQNQFCNALSDQIKGPFFEAYATLKACHKNFPLIAHLEENRCSACHVSVSRETVTLSKDCQQPVFCENCGRLVYTEKKAWMSRKGNF